MKLIRVIVLLAVLVGLLATSLPVYAQSTVEDDIGSANGFSTPNQRQTFYAAGSYWAFYTYTAGGEPQDFYFESSTDGITWGNKTLACTVSSSDLNASVFFDGTYVHYVVSRDVAGVKVYYRRGTPVSDGTITWSAAEQVVTASIGTSSFVSADSNGYPWVTTTIANHAWVIKSDTANGTWSTEAGFPYELSTTLTHPNYGITIPLTDGKMLAIYSGSGGETIRSQRWTGAAWGAERATATSSMGAQYFSAVAQDADVHLVMPESPSTDIHYERYDYSTNSWTDNTAIATGGTNTNIPVITRTDLNDLYVFAQDLPDENKIYYIKYDYYAGTWGNATEFVDETVLDGLVTWDDRLNCDYNPDSDKVGVYYLAVTQKLKYKDLAEVANVITLAPTGVTTTSATLRGEITSTGSGSITVRGVQYNTTPSATGAGYSQESGSFGTGVFSFPVTDFEADELYYCRAYATNSEGTAYGEWVAWISAVQGAEPEQPDEPDEGMAPPVDTEGPVNWVTDPSLRTFDSWPFSDVINAFADMVSRSFAWFCFMVFAVSLVGIALCKYTRHLGITFLALGMLLGLYIAGDAIDWWLIFPYLLVGISLIIKEQQYGWG